MRTTVTLDEDLVVKLKELAHRQGSTFKEVVNAAIRRGLTRALPSTRQTKPFRVKTFHSPFRPGVDPLKLNQMGLDQPYFAAGDNLMANPELETFFKSVRAFKVRRRDKDEGHLRAHFWILP